jgi:hypothetical protein
MDNGFNEDFNLVFDGQGLPDVRSFAAQDLTTGRPYRFYVQAFNYAGVSPISDVTTIYACQDPGVIDAPQLSAIQTDSLIPLQWNAPDTSGGCSITGYEILRNAGPGTAITTSIHQTSIQDRPSLRMFDVTDLPAAILG